MIYRNGLFRDPSQGWIAGVAAGLADRFGVNVTVVRLVFVLLGLAGTPILAAIAYAALAVLLPARPLPLEMRSNGRAWRYR